MSVTLVCAGLRTLCVAVVDVPADFYNEWKETYHRASTSMFNRVEKMRETAELIERVRL